MPDDFAGHGRKMFTQILNERPVYGIIPDTLVGRLCFHIDSPALQEEFPMKRNFEILFAVLGIFFFSLLPLSAEAVEIRHYGDCGSSTECGRPNGK